MVCKKSVVAKTLIVLAVLFMLFHCGIRSFADGPYVAQYDVYPFYFAKGNFTLYCAPNDRNITHYDFVCDVPEDTYTLLYVNGLGVQFYSYCPLDSSAKISHTYYCNDGSIFSSSTKCSGDYGIVFSSWGCIANESLFTDHYVLGYDVFHMREKFREFVDLGYASQFKESTIVDTSLIRNDVNFGLQNVKVSCVDNQLTLNWSIPYSMPDAIEYPIFIDLLIEDRDTGESALYFYPETESITLRPSPCDVNDLTYNFDVGNIKDIPENFYIKSVSLTPCYIVHLEYLDMDITYKGQTSHVFLNYSGTDKKPIYQAPVIQTPPDTEIIEEDMPTSIFGAITNFFSGFFNNFGQMLKNLFIPTKDDFIRIYNQLDVYFSEKLGFIWYPFDLAVDLVACFANAEQDGTLTVPPMNFDILGGISIYDGGTFQIDSTGIFVYVRYITSILVCCALAGLAYNKWADIVKGE